MQSAEEKKQLWLDKKQTPPLLHESKYTQQRCARQTSGPDESCIRIESIN